MSDEKYSAGLNDLEAYIVAKNRNVDIVSRNIAAATDVGPRMPLNPSSPLAQMLEVAAKTLQFSSQLCLPRNPSRPDSRLGAQAGVEPNQPEGPKN